jgi:glutathione S-transferase
MFRSQPSEAWTARCRGQIADTLAVLEAELAARGSPYWLGSSLSHADVACACALRFTREAHPDLYDHRRHPALEAQARGCEALADFAATYQVITNVR